MEVPNWLLRADPDRLAVNSLTYGELIDRARTALIPRVSSAGIALPPGEQFAVVLHALWMRGIVAVPQDPRVPQNERPAAAIELTKPPDYGEPVDPVPLDLSAPAAHMKTSGTSGIAKRVSISFGNFLWSALGSAAMLDVRPDDRWLCAMPLSHVGGLSILVRSAIYGTTAIVHERWDTERVAQTDATLISLVPTTLKRLLDAGWTGGPNLRWALIGGAPLSVALREQAQDAGVPVAETYGLTETTSQVTTFGHPLFCTRVRLSSQGEIVVSGPTVTSPGPLYTGDLGAWRSDGTLQVTGRKSDTIITGGENVAPTDVESVLEQHPAVAEALVSARSDVEWGEAIVATIVLTPGQKVSGEELKAFCFSRLAGFQIPKQFGFATELPRTASGKLMRHRL
ncbi:MAG TPA: AMP-binding protein [Baekduia sp.]|nr:AMP-binding protein [Baekduia sp.]